MEESIKNIHSAVQYLSAAGQSFLPKEKDDSQSNLAWNAETNSLETRDLGMGVKLMLSLESGLLAWNRTIEKMDLRSHTHQEILAWLTDTSTTLGLTKPYLFSFSYKLDYPEIEADDRYSFNLSHSESLAQHFTLAQKAMISFLKTNSLSSEIRVWPHHFDMGIYTKLKDQFFLGAGLAIPDSLENEFYFYVSGWKDGIALATEDLPKLTVGSWHPNWKGATLKSTRVSEMAVITFLNEVKNIFIANS